MKQKMKAWWNVSIDVIKAMDASPYADLYVEVASLRRQTEFLSSRVEAQSIRRDDRPQCVVVKLPSSSKSVSPG